jgi:hypothetical protein
MVDDYADDETTTGVLAMGATVKGTLETIEDGDWFKVDLKADHGYYITPSMANGQVPMISVWMQGSPMVRYTTITGSLFSNELYNPFSPMDTGTYFIEIHSAQQPGNYTLGLHEAPDDFSNDPGSERLLTATPTAGNFDYAFDTDKFRVAAVAGTTYTVTLNTDSGNIGNADFIRLSHQDLRYTYQTGGATTGYTFTAENSGDYVISAELASYYPPSAGGLAYHISVSAFGASAPTTPIVNPPPPTVPAIPPVIPPVAPPVIPPVIPKDTGPEIVSAIGTVDGAIIVTFDEAPVLADRGSILLIQGSNAVATVAWEAGDSRIHLSGKTLTLYSDHAVALVPGKYSLHFTDRMLTDTAGNLGTSYAYNIVHVHGTAGGGVTPVLSGHGERVHGSAGFADAVVVNGRLSDYQVTRETDGFKISDGYFVATVSDIERIMFTKSNDVVALSLDGPLGQAFRLYTAAFDRVPDQGGLGYWLHKAELGVSLGDIARSFIASKEFSDLYGTGPGDGDFLGALYQNVLHRDGESGGVAYWMDRLSHGADRGDVLAAFSESAENQEQAVALIGNGVAYTPYG